MGGMGEVYRAFNGKLNRNVALKVQPEVFALDADRVARFRREAQVLASLNHPNIAAVCGFEDSGDVHPLVMERVKGVMLAEFIAGSRLSAMGLAMHGWQFLQRACRSHEAEIAVGACRGAAEATHYKTGRDTQGLRQPPDGSSGGHRNRAKHREGDVRREEQDRERQAERHRAEWPEQRQRDARERPRIGPEKPPHDADDIDQ